MPQAAQYSVRSIRHGGASHLSASLTLERANTLLQGICDALSLRSLPGQSLGVTVTLEHDQAEPGSEILERVSV